MLMKVRPASLADGIKRLLRVRRITMDTDDGRFSVDPISDLGLALSRDRCYEAKMRSTLQQFLRPGNTFVDLGANEGYFTVIGAGLCAPGGRVVAIEPQKRLLDVINDNVKLNNSQGVQVVNAAISDHAGTATFHLTSSTNSGGSSLQNPCKYDLPTEEVATLTLSELLDNEDLQHVDFMKVDIEGFEHEALMGSPQVFRERRIRSMALELHPSLIEARGKSCDAILRMLEECGYQITKPFGHWVWTAPAR